VRCCFYFSLEGESEAHFSARVTPICCVCICLSARYFRDHQDLFIVAIKMRCGFFFAVIFNKLLLSGSMASNHGH